RGDAGDDIYVFADDWGKDTVAGEGKDSIDYSQTSKDIVHTISGNAFYEAGTGTFTLDADYNNLGFNKKVSTGTFAAGEPVSSSNDPSTLADEVTGTLSGIYSISTGTGANTFYFGNDWGSLRVINNGAGGKLTVDFSAVTEDLEFTFMPDDSVVIKVGGIGSKLRSVGSLVGLADEAKSITIKGVTADTTIISGVGANKYVLGKDENDVVTSQFLGTLFINNGEKWTATPGLLGAVYYIPTGI